MKAPIKWLNNFTPIENIDTAQISHEVTMTGSKVEGVLVTGQDIKNVVVGQITDISKHPNADKLSICKVNISTAPSQLDKSIQIVTGATNVKIGDKVPVALDGAELAGGVKIKTGELRGVSSEGMLCSVNELGFTKDDFNGAAEDGIFILSQDASIGVDIVKFLGLGQTIIDFEITSNRPDCLSIEGLAREIAITMNLPFKPLVPHVKTNSNFSLKNMIDVEITAPDLCRRYMARVIRNVKIGSSPDWMVANLRAANVRSINNIVDITNYVMLELGQPMHAFDYDLLEDKKIIVRRAIDGEVLTTLDETKKILDNTMLVIADRQKAVGLAGIMGGENSQITADTRTIVFESANFEGINTRLTAKKLGMRTESSSRFEKGLDPENAKRAIDRACELVQLLGCGEVSDDEIDIYPTKLTSPRIEFRPSRINSFLGTEISEDIMLDILSKIGCDVIIDNNIKYIQPPSFRADLEDEVDLSEEIARFYGYNNITPTLLSGKSTTLGGLSKTQKQKELISSVMRSSGYYEACTYSFISPKAFDRICLSNDDVLRNAVVVSNPLGEDFSLMRTTMLPSLLDIASLNKKRGVNDFKIFELARIYSPNTINSDELPIETEILGAVLCCTNDDDKSTDSFFAAKGSVEELLRQLGFSNVTFTSCKDNPSFHPGKTAKVYNGDIEIGIIGCIHPDVAKINEAPLNTVVIMLDAGVLTKSTVRVKKYKQLPKFPSITRDLSIIADKNIFSSAINEVIEKFAGQYLESIKLFDVYTGKQIDQNKKSISYQLVFRSNSGTLTDDIINPEIEKIIRALSSELSATLR